MDSRLKFLHHLRLIDDAVTQKDRTSAVMVNRVGDERPAGSQVHLPSRLSVHGTEIQVGKRLISRWREKQLRIWLNLVSKSSLVTFKILMTRMV